ncbi:uncharacterized protein [Amphiura filiformis]|uniref:uncharacterized protein n=1 Tax=Amphiura filiformis TaxID=82378 RepID=UPI003B214B84
MEWLEQKAIANAPIACRPKLWKRYVDDILEIIPKGTTQELTDHLNKTDPTNNIKFNHEEEAEGKIPFLDTLINRKEDGSVKTTVYRKKTHTDQYLNFASQHPLHQKLGVVRTLLDRKDAIVTEEEDKQQEEEHIKHALNQCGYPNWTIEKVKHQIRDKTKAKKKVKDKNTQRSKGMVVIPYVQGVSERLQRVFKKHNIQTAMRPHNTLKQNLVHPKDKIEATKTCDCVYEIPCKSCKKSYIGETGRPFGVRLKEHLKESEKITERKFTRAVRKESVDEINKSAITDHVSQQNHVIDWDGAKVIDIDSCANLVLDQDVQPRWQLFRE